VSRMRQTIILTAILCTLLASVASAQTELFTIKVQQNDTIADLPLGGTVLMEAPGIGVQTTASITVTYNGRLTNEGFQDTTITAVELTGSLDFQISNPGAPFAMTRGESFTVNTGYTPSISALQEGQIGITYEGDDTTPTFTVNLDGTAPEFAYTYTPDGGNETQVMPGATLAFPDTQVDSTATGTFTITNRGTATGTASNITASGTGYALTGLPLLPVEIAADGTLSFTVNFTPEALGMAAGQLAVQLAGGPANFPLEGSGTGAQFTYELIDGDSTKPVSPGGVINLPDTQVDEVASILMRVRNMGNTEGVISSISASGSAYGVDDLPFLPATLQPDGTALFTITFTPATIGRQVGRLLVGAEEFDLIGEGVGSFTEYSYTVSGTTTPVEDAGTVIFTPVAVGASTAATFTVTNSGTTETTINSISLGSTGSAFSLSGLPGLPLTLNGGSSSTFTITLQPTVEGATTDSLLVGSASFTLSGTGTPPNPLPTYTFAGDGGVQAPASQPAVGVILNEPYDLKVTGVLTLTFASDVFSDDPAVQFATGGRTVTFEIAAGATEALFPNGTNRIKIQTGTVAGTITLTPSFSTTGGADLTPDEPAVQTMSILAGAPVITGAAISHKAFTSMDVQVTGFATSRNVNQIAMQFTVRPGENLATTSLNIAAGAEFAAWYGSTQSTPYGSLFTVTIPLDFGGATNSVTGQTNAIQSITVTLGNSQGTSATVTIPVPEN
jgi:ASPM-SPD-2-Hydin domain-containing protein